MVHQLIYSSLSTTPMAAEDLEELLEHARKNNASQNITGALLYVDHMFLQVLEGQRESVLALMAKIAKDLRHETVTVLKEHQSPVAQFADWQMAYVAATAQQVADWAGLGRSSTGPALLAEMRQMPGSSTDIVHGILAALAQDGAGRGSDLDLAP